MVPAKMFDPRRGPSVSPGLAFTLLCAVCWFGCHQPPQENRFVQLMNVGKNYYDQGEAEKAIPVFKEALNLQPTHPDALLNLANSYLLADDANEALAYAQQAIALEPNSAAAHYVAGCAHRRLLQFEEALKEFQTARNLDPTVGTVTFQLAQTHYDLRQYQDSIDLLTELVRFEPEHPRAHYYLGQALTRAQRAEEARAVFERHQEILAKLPPGSNVSPTELERCVHTMARAPFLTEQPSVPGIQVTFQDITLRALPNSEAYSGPVGVIDYHHDGRNSLFAREAGEGFRLLSNSNGVFTPIGFSLPVPPETNYERCLVADLQNDRFEDILVLGDQGSLLFQFATNAQILDSSLFSRLGDLRAVEGVFVDLDFTGKLDLLTLQPNGEGVQVFKNLGGLFFRDTTTTSGIPATATGAVSVAVDDWNNDDMLDIVLARLEQPPLILVQQRGGALAPTDTPPSWPVAQRAAFGDLNNDLRADLLLATTDSILVALNGVQELRTVSSNVSGIQQLLSFDYDNDGWLDIIAGGRGLRAWRNEGQHGFVETTASIGLDTFATDEVKAVGTADFDRDGDSDLVVTLRNGNIRILDNEGGNANLQVKVRLVGNRSNASGIGTRVDVSSGGLRLGRRVSVLPIEIGVGQHETLESVDAKWLNLSMGNVDVVVDPAVTLPMTELVVPGGSCPYLYAWDGTQFRFITDILSASPLGLRISDSRFVEADEDEFVWLGSENQIKPLEGDFVLQVTEELREVLYLDDAELVVVDHPEGTEVYPTDKMVPGRPFPPHGIITLHRPYRLLRATRSDGLEVTERLATADRHLASPVKQRIPQLRGLAEPWSLTLDFGPLDIDKPLVLAINAWLRFGGGMANVAASHDPNLPFPFPTLEVETGPERWEPVDVVFGTPAGKTKRMVVDLTGRLPVGSRRLRISTAYEIHWDRIALLERAPEDGTRVSRFDPETANLHWRGFADFEDAPWYLPLTPDYERARPNSVWRIMPMGWCTRYGDVLELVTQRDDALALVNGGDELTLRFPASRLPEKAAGTKRDFFFYSSGWDKDADFHCEKGWLVEPLPWHGMDDQQYGQQSRPVIDNDWWIKEYNTRWVGPVPPRRPEPETALSRR